MYLTVPVGFADSGSVYTVSAKNALGTVTSTPAALSVIAVTPVDMLTYHNDVSRTGANLHEERLNPSNVTQTHFRKLGVYPVDGKVDGQILIASGLRVGGTLRNVAYAATEHDSIFAYDADTGTLLWTTSLLGSGELPSDPRACNFVAPEIGVTATPVIDRARDAIYLVSASRNASGTIYYQRLHALNLETGAEMLGGPTTVPSAIPGQSQTFDSTQYLERAALLLVNDRIYTSWTSHCDQGTYSGWVITFDASTLQIAQTFNATAGTVGGRGSFWNAGSGPAADASGSVYLMSANGVVDGAVDAHGFQVNNDYGNSFIKIAPPIKESSTMAVQDYFTMYNAADESLADKDLGSGGVMLLPDLPDNSGTIRHLAVGAGKDNNIYLVNRDDMGKVNPSDNSQIWQELDNAFVNAQYGIFGSPAYFNNQVFYAPVSDAVYAYTINDARLSVTPSSHTPGTFPYPGAAFSISANGAAQGILWALENSATQGVLHAYDASDLGTELYNSTQAGTADNFGPGTKFSPPTVANGKVYFGTQIDLTKNPTGLQNGIVVFGAY